MLLRKPNTRVWSRVTGEPGRVYAPDPSNPANVYVRFDRPGPIDPLSVPVGLLTLDAIEAAAAEYRDKGGLPID